MAGSEIGAGLRRGGRGRTLVGGRGWTAGSVRCHGAARQSNSLAWRRDWLYVDAVGAVEEAAIWSRSRAMMMGRALATPPWRLAPPSCEAHWHYAPAGNGECSKQVSVLGASSTAGAARCIGDGDAGLLNWPPGPRRPEGVGVHRDLALAPTNWVVGGQLKRVGMQICQRAISSTVRHDLPCPASLHAQRQAQMRIRRERLRRRLNMPQSWARQPVAGASPMIQYRAI